MLSKQEIARRQLGTALALFIEEQDPVSVHVLACGGAEVAYGLAERASVETFQSWVEQDSGLSASDVKRKRNEFWNAFKHFSNRAGKERQDDELVAKFSELNNEHTLFWGWFDYSRTIGSRPVEAEIFELWFLAKHQPEIYEYLKSKTPSLVALGLDGLGAADLDTQRQRLRTAVKMVMSDPALARGTGTENRPLILGAV